MGAGIGANGKLEHQDAKAIMAISLVKVSVFSNQFDSPFKYNTLIIFTIFNHIQRIYHLIFKHIQIYKYMYCINHPL